MAWLGKALVEVAMPRVGAATPTDLVRALDLDVHGYGKVHRWMSGISDPDCESTLNLLSRAGLLQPEAEAAWRGVSFEEAEAAVTRARTEATERALASLAAREEHAPRKRQTG